MNLFLTDTTDSTTQVMVLIASTLLSVSVVLLMRMPLLWLFARTEKVAPRTWDIDTHRYDILRREHSFFRYFSPWIIGMARKAESAAPWLVLNPKTEIKSAYWRSLRDALFGDPLQVQAMLLSGLARGPWRQAEFLAFYWSIGIAGALLLTPVVTDAILSLSGIATFVVVCWGIYRVLLIQLQARVDARRRQIRRLLPHALDSLAMTLSAGGTFPEACHDLARDFPDHPLAMEFSRMLTEIQRGQTSHHALAALAQRIDVPEFHDIIRTMTITVEHGTPAAEFFRLSAQKIRYSQLKQMETAIGVAEAKMPLPTFVIMVACMLVAIAPFAVTAINSGFLETIGAYSQGH